MIGQTKQDEREFLAFHWEATANEKAGTGRVSYSTRLKLIDTALGYFHCLSQANQTKYAQKRQDLLALRRTYQAASGQSPTAAPAACMRQP
jgi:hypothetical protein